MAIFYGGVTEFYPPGKCCVECLPPFECAAKIPSILNCNKTKTLKADRGWKDPKRVRQVSQCAFPPFSAQSVVWIQQQFCVCKDRI